MKYRRHWHRTETWEEEGPRDTGFPRRRMRSQLYRSSSDKVFLGVLGGIAEHMDIPTWPLRVGFVVLTVILPLTGPIWAAYFIMGMFVMKKRSDFRPEETPAPDTGWEMRDQEAPRNDWKERHRFGRHKRKEREAKEDYRFSASHALRQAKDTFDRLEKRLQNLESIVTSPSFGLEEEWRNL